MIYFDNAATTKYKPDEVLEAFEFYVKEIGVSPGRGSYRLGIEASRMLYQTRKKVASYFGLNNANVIFTKNSTEAMNLFFNGYLKKGMHVVITCYEHNAVLRPIHALFEQGIIEYSVIMRDDMCLAPKALFEKYAKENTTLFVMTLASNLTGRVIFSREIAEYMKEKGICVFVDASQGAGKISLSIERDSIDYLAFTGHKDLMGLPGVGGLCCRKEPKWAPLLQGGTGIFGDAFVNPSVFPEGYEAGTLNMPAIWALGSAINFLDDRRSELCEKERELYEYLHELLKRMNHILIYDNEYKRISICGINICGKKSSEVVEYLDQNGICARGGIHCAILAHKALKTVKTGIVRISLSPYNTKEEIEKLAEVLDKCR